MEKARRKLEVRLQAPELVACPECGRYQEHMLRQHKNRCLEIGFTIDGLAAPLLWLVGASSGLDPWLSLWIALAVAGLGLAGIVAWCVGWAPNSRMSEAALKARAAASVALPVDEFLREQAALAQQRALRAAEARESRPAP